MEITNSLQCFISFSFSLVCPITMVSAYAWKFRKLTQAAEPTLKPVLRKLQEQLLLRSATSENHHKNIPRNFDNFDEDWGSVLSGLVSFLY